jgi:hypothetical protein
MAVMGRLSYNAGYIKKNKRGDEGNQGKRGTEKGWKTAWRAFKIIIFSGDMIK